MTKCKNCSCLASCMLYDVSFYLQIFFADFHPVDVDKVKLSDSWLKRFLEHHEFNEQEAFNMLWETCTWRSNFGTNGKIILTFTFNLIFS